MICLEEQIQQFTTVRENITDLLGSTKAADDLLQNSIYIISVGSNDLFEYEATQIFGHVDPKPFVTNLTQAYAAHLMVRNNLLIGFSCLALI